MQDWGTNRELMPREDLQKVLPHKHHVRLMTLFYQDHLDHDVLRLSRLHQLIGCSDRTPYQLNAALS